jgi:hypothetical protein
MLKALVRKELRELLPIIVVAVLAQIVVVLAGTGVQLGFVSSFLGQAQAARSGAIPFLSDDTITQLFLVVAAGALGVGLWQTMRESAQGTYPFLLHRPVEREAALGAKLVLGVVFCLLLIALPLLFYAFWAATPGTHASPFMWAMTAPFWPMCICMPLIYLGAFLSGLRPGRWYGSRFLPLLAGGITAGICTMLLFVIQSIVWLVLAIVIVVEIGYLAAIWYVAQSRDYS